MCNSVENLGLIIIIYFVFVFISSYVTSLDLPSFRSPVENITVAVGREAILVCAVENLNPYKVAWLKVDTQTILTIHNHVITKNNRIGIYHTQNNVWQLHIKDVRESDCGWYMCQINTDPMKSEKGYLSVVVPPDILDHPTSTDMVVDEGANITLQCIVSGKPEPKVIWKREDGEKYDLKYASDIIVNGTDFTIINVKRHHMGAYLCIATNGVPPSVSKRIQLIVQFQPTIWVKHQLVAAYDGQTVTLECLTEAYPKSINYWTKDTGEIIPYGLKYIPEVTEKGYKVHMKLKINYLELNDYGVYKCISKNAIADMEGSINIYRISDPVKMILGKRKQNHHNTSIAFSPRLSDEGNNSDNITYRKMTAGQDPVSIPTYYGSTYASCSLSTFIRYLIICYIILSAFNITFI